MMLPRLTTRCPKTTKRLRESRSFRARESPWLSLSQSDTDDPTSAVPVYADVLHAHTGTSPILQSGVRLDKRNRSKAGMMAALTATKRERGDTDDESSAPSSSKVCFDPFWLLAKVSRANLNSAFVVAMGPSAYARPLKSATHVVVTRSTCCSLGSGLPVAGCVVLRQLRVMTTCKWKGKAPFGVT